MEQPRQPPVQVTLNATAAQMLARLAVEMNTEDVAGLVVRALGLLEMAHSARKRGSRLVLVNAGGEQSDVAY